ncbi:MAG: hypothetical protein PHF17_07625 [Arcobacteraceae bacterium]|nr:hypothetical protein [Arcobacteraceae bacterium]
MIQNILLKFFFFFIFFTLSLFGEVIVTGTTKTGYFLDSKVSGLHYQCNNGGLLKKTGSDGNFTYDNTCGEITFSLNNKIILGKIAVAKIPLDTKLYITDFVGLSRIDTNNVYVRNLARLLQSLDSDEIPKNGITINSAQITKAVTLDFSKLQPDDKLLEIIHQQYQTRSVVSDLCAIVHLEEVLKDLNDSRYYIDTVPPCKPKLAYDVLATSNDKTYIEFTGEKNSKIYINGIYTNLNLDNDGKFYDFELNTTMQRDTFDDFNVTFIDATGKISEPLSLSIYNDTDQPFITNIPTNNIITVTHPSQAVITFTSIDDSINHGIPVSYEILGVDKDLFSIVSSGDADGILSFKSPSTTGTYHITMKVIDKANHYDTVDISIVVN